MDGVLLIDKPAGWTSFDVVNKVRSIIEHSGLNTTGKKRFPVGHSGTLDPLATGLLVILLGSYTKRATELSKSSKVYEVTMRLGETSTTGDSEGDLTAPSKLKPSSQLVEDTINSFKGEIEQTPPIYSAIKVNGQRAYKLARQGKNFELKPRLVHIYGIDLRTYKYPDVEFKTEVSSGTYIRSLVEDIGKKLETGAFMLSLKRTSVADFDISNAISANELSKESIERNINLLENS